MANKRFHGVSFLRALSSAVGVVGLACGTASDDSAHQIPLDAAESQPDDVVISTDGAVEQAAAELCNGSDDVRFVYATAGGGEVTIPFMSENGHRYVAINGRCEYWLGEASLQGLRGGVVNADRAATLAKDLQYGSYGSVSEYRGPGCEDCAATVLMDNTGKLIKDSSGSPNAAEPPVWTAAMRAAGEVFEALRGTAAPIAATKTLLALRTGRSDAVGTVPLSLEDRAIERQNADEYGQDPAYWIVVEDESILQMLNDMQRTTLVADQNASTIVVQDMHGGTYELLLRDEPPAPVATAIEAAID